MTVASALSLLQWSDTARCVTEAHPDNKNPRCWILKSSLQEQAEPEHREGTGYRGLTEWLLLKQKWRWFQWFTRIINTLNNGTHQISPQGLRGLNLNACFNNVSIKQAMLFPSDKEKRGWGQWFNVLQCCWLCDHSISRPQKPALLNTQRLSSRISRNQQREGTGEHRFTWETATKTEAVMVSVVQQDHSYFIIAQKPASRYWWNEKEQQQIDTSFQYAKFPKNK